MRLLKTREYKMARDNRNSGRARAMAFLGLSLLLSAISVGVLMTIITSYEGRISGDAVRGCTMVEQNVLGQDCYECQAAPYKRCVRTGSGR